MALMWFLTGGAVVAAAVAINKMIKAKKAKLSVVSWICLILSIFFALFAFIWSISSIIEGENQAAGMGLVLFGGATLILVALSRRSILKDMR